MVIEKCLKKSYFFNIISNNVCVCVYVMEWMSKRHSFNDDKLWIMIVISNENKKKNFVMVHFRFKMMMVVGNFFFIIFIQFSILGSVDGWRTHMIYSVFYLWLFEIFAILFYFCLFCSGTNIIIMELNLRILLSWCQKEIKIEKFGFNLFLFITFFLISQFSIFLITRS